MAARKGNWIKGPLTTENGQRVEAQYPEIISASRSTDIPAFYCDWFFHPPSRLYGKCWNIGDQLYGYTEKLVFNKSFLASALSKPVWPQHSAYRKDFK